jgi:hypothetical protein
MRLSPIATFLALFLARAAGGTSWECPDPPKRVHGVISVHVDSSEGHQNYRLDFPPTLGGHKLEMVQLFVGKKDSSWVMTYLHPKKTELRGAAGKLSDFVATLNDNTPLSVVAFYGMPPFCSIISEISIRK